MRRFIPAPEYVLAAGLILLAIAVALWGLAPVLASR